MDDVDTLNLCYAGLQSVDSILQLQNLKRLFLRYNEISSFEEIQKLKNLPNLESLSLIGNEIYKHPEYRYYAILYWLLTTVINPRFFIRLRIYKPVIILSVGVNL